MFENTVSGSIEQNPTARIWTTIASFGIQVVGVGLLVLMPLIYTQALPNLRISEAPPVPHAPRMQEEVTKLQPIPDELKTKPQLVNGHLIAPSTIPTTINRTPEPEAPPAVFLIDGNGVLYGDSSSEHRRDAVMDRLLAHAVPPPARPDPLPVHTAVRPSVFLEGNLVRRIEPVYPTSARTAHIQGQVVLQAIIDREGRIVQLKANSGNPLLIGAAVDAVRQWRYRPYVLNGSPIEVETQITVNFMLR